MKHLFAAALLFGLATGCSNPEKTTTPGSVEATRIKALTKDFDTWYRYAYSNVVLSRDFHALDVAGQPMSKKAFLGQLVRGGILAVRNGPDQPRPVYQLCRLPEGQDPAIRATSKYLATEELANENRRGQTLPAFRYVDLNGVTYTSATTRGKVVVLKCWYTSCVACVEEFPTFNALVDSYQQHPEVVFVSLALNKAEHLRPFLKERPVKVAVVPTSEAYLTDTLQVVAYPTHLILDRDGKIAKVTTRVSDLAVALAKEVPLIRP